MYPTTFHNDEIVLSPPTGQHGEIGGLRVLRMKYQDGSQAMVSCWKLTPQDLQNIKETGRIFIAVIGPHPPILPTTDFEDLGLDASQINFE